NLRNASIQTTLIHIQRQTNYSFVATENLIKKTKPVTINVKDKPLPEVLSMIAHGQPFDYKIKQNVVTLTEKKVVKNKPDKLLNQAQQRPLVGKVAGAEDEILQEVSIHITGTQTGTTTNPQGEFAIEVEVEK